MFAMKDPIRKNRHIKSSYLIVSIGFLVILYGAVMQMLISINAGIMLVYLCGVAITLLGLFIDIVLKHKWMISVVGIAAATPVLLTGLILVSSSNYQVSNDEDAIIILGAGIDGDKITPQLAKRLDTGVCYFNDNPETIIVVSGGQGHGETTTEAAAMKKYLIEKGVPDSAVLTEEQSTSTFSNISNSKQILDDYFEKEYKVVIVTNRYHTYRADIIAKKAGMNYNILCADTPPIEIPLRYLRECASICKYYLLLMLGFNR